MEPPGHHADRATCGVHAAHELVSADRDTDRPLRALHDVGLEARQGRDPLPQALGEVEFPAHGALRDRLDLWSGPGVLGEQFDDLVLEQGGVGIEDDEEARHATTVAVPRTL